MLVLDLGIVALLGEPLLVAATVAMFVVAATGKIASYAAVRDWVAHRVPAAMAAPAAFAMIAFDVCVALALLATSTSPHSHVIAAGTLLVLFVARSRLGHVLRTCPCFGRARLPSPRTINLILAVLMAAHVVAYAAFPTAPTRAHTEWTMAGAVMGSVIISWILIGGRRASSVSHGVLTPEQVERLQKDIGLLAPTLPKRTLVLSGHPTCSSCTLIAAAWISMTRCFPAQWLNLIDMSTRLGTRSAAVEGVPLTSLTAPVRNALEIHATPALTLIDDSGRYTTYQGADSCQRAMTELMAELRTQPRV